MRKIIFLLSLLVIQLSLQAQQFPVQVTPQLLAPYTTQISDYYSAAGNPKLSLLLLNKDFNRPTLSVRLRMTIEGQGVRIKTREDVNFTPVTILAGQPYYISPAELQQYFNVNNIELSGITQQEYIQTGKLPEGFYTYCFETVETTTGQTVSNKGCSFAWINLNEPPFLNLPAKGESVIPAVSPTAQNITFYWTPRHTASPGAAYTTTYIFTLVEITDNSLAPEAAFVNGMVRHVDSTNNSNYPYDNTKPILVEGKKYAWQVRAKTKDANNNIEVANFKNNGNSEVFWFLYKNNCPPVTGISDSLNGISGYRAIISWLGNPQHLGYKIVYREKNTPNAAWFNITTTGVQASLNDLKPATEYEYRVGTACEEGVFTFAGSRYFTTKDSTYTTVNVPNCGIDPNLVTPPNTSPLATLIPGDTIRAGDFKVVVTNNPTPTGSAGTFSGAGYVPVSYLGNMKLAVVFTSIGISNINNEKRLVSGQIQTTYDPSEGGIESIDDYIDIFVGGQSGSLHTGLTQVDTTFGFPIQWPNGITMQLPFPPAGYDTLTGIGGPIHINIIPATPPGGATVTYTVNSLPKVIRDTTGHIYQINANGTVTSLGQAGGGSILTRITKDLIDDDKGLVKFVEYNAPKVKYAFDEWKQIYTNSNTFNKEYERIKTKTDGKYYVSAKAIAPAVADYLKASFTKTDMSLKYDSIKFISGKGIIYDYKLLDSLGGAYNYEVNVVGGPENDAQEIYAVYPQTGAKNLNLGKVFVASYERKNISIKIVPVNRDPIDLTNIKAELNKIYGGINVSLDISQDERFNNLSWDIISNGGKLDITGSSFLTSSSKEMLALNKAYANIRPVKSHILYLFLLNESNELSVKGDMPRSKQFGYIFTNNNNIITKTIAHEIGHGVFNLKHTYDYGIAKNLLTENLMNASDGTKLAKAQWDLIADPALVLGIFEKDKDAQLSIDNMNVFNNVKNTDGTYTFLTPGGQPITLPSNTLSVRFGEITSFSTTDPFTLKDIPQACLTNFTIGTDIFNAYSNTAYTEFSHYQKGEDALTGTYKDELTKNQFIGTTKKAIIVYPCVQEDKSSLYGQTIVIDNDTWNKSLLADYKGTGLFDSATNKLVRSYLFTNPNANSGNFLVTEIDNVKVKSEYYGNPEIKNLLVNNVTCGVGMNIYLLRIANLIYRFPGCYESYKKCNADSLMFSEFAVNGGNSFITPAIAFLYLTKSKNIVDNIVKSLDAIKKINGETDYNKLEDILSNLCGESDYKMLTSEQRIHIIKTLTNQQFISGCTIEDGKNCEERQLIYTVSTTPAGEQSQAVYDYLKSQPAVLFRLMKDVDRGSNQSLMFFALADIYSKALGVPSVDLGGFVTTGKVYRYDAEVSVGGNLYRMDYSLPTFYDPLNTSPPSVPNFLRIDETYHRLSGTTVGVDFGGTNGFATYMHNPFDEIAIEFTKDYKINGETIIPVPAVVSGEQKGVIVKMPALLFYYMEKANADAEASRRLRLTLKGMALLAGGWELSAARTVGGALLATLDIVAVASDLYLNEAHHGQTIINAITDPVKKQRAIDIFNGYNTIVTYYGYFRGGTAAVQLGLAIKNFINVRKVQVQELYNDMNGQFANGSAEQRLLKKLDDVAITNEILLPEKWGSLEDLLLNIKYKSIYDPLLNGSNIRKFAQYNVTIAEEAALKLYVGEDFYANFNKAMAGEIGITSEFEAVKRLLISAHSKFPKVVDINVFRGAGVSESQFAKNLSLEQEFDFKGRFTSSSNNEFTADLFRQGRKGDVIWKIKSKTGIDLQAINPDEAEIFFNTMTKFKLKRISPSITNPSVKIYEIIEL
jgi:TANFOR domain-containing protein